MVGVVADGVQATHEELERWGAWVRSLSGIGGGLKSSLAEQRFTLVRIDDGRAQLLDCAVAQLGRRSSAACAAVRYYFVNEMSYRDMGTMLDVSHSKARMEKDVGVAWIDGRLSDGDWCEAIEKKLGISEKIY